MWSGIRWEARSQGSTRANTPRMSRGSSSSITPPIEARNSLTDEEWALWKPLLGGPPSEEALDLYPDLEWSDNDRNLAQASVAKKLKPMPFIVFQSDEPFDLTPYVEDGTLPMTAEEAEQFRKLLYQAWQDAMADLVSQVPGARLITDTDSGHYIHQEQPQLVIDSVREVLDAVEQQGPLTDTGGVPPSVILLASALLLGTSLLVARRVLRVG